MKNSLPIEMFDWPFAYGLTHHISTVYLKSESRGGCVCLACNEFVALTFPEDIEGTDLTLPE